VVSPFGWLESNIWFLLGTEQVAVGPVVAHYQFVQGGPICFVSARWQLHCPTATTLAGQSALNLYPSPLLCFL
jgi:hypothetical protein